MRTLLAVAALGATTAAHAHAGHSEAPVHWHGGDVLALTLMAAVVVVVAALWLWRRSRH